MQLVRYNERPRLWENIRELLAEVWPEYRWHGEVLSRYWRNFTTCSPDGSSLYDTVDWRSWQRAIAFQSRGTARQRARADSTPRSPRLRPAMAGGITAHGGKRLRERSPLGIRNQPKSISTVAADRASSLDSRVLGPRWPGLGGAVTARHPCDERSRRQAVEQQARQPLVSAVVAVRRGPPIVAAGTVTPTTTARPGHAPTPRSSPYRYGHCRSPGWRPSPAARARTIAWARSATCSLVKILDTWLRMVLGLR
jgi:hypothetical protein